MPTGGENISVFVPRIDFSDYAKYAYVLVGEAGNIWISFKAIKEYSAAVKRYQFDLTYWNNDLDSLADSMIHYLVSRYENGKDAELIKKVVNLPMAKEIDGNYLTGFEMELQREGNYIFSSVSLGHGELDIAVLNENKKIIASDKSKNGLGMTALEVKGDKQKISFISYSKDKDVVQNMMVYFFPSGT